MKNRFLCVKLSGKFVTATQTSEFNQVKFNQVKFQDKTTLILEA